MARALSHLLILEPDPRGHACEWIEHLLAALPSQPTPEKLSVVVAAELATMLDAARGRLPAGRIGVVPMTAREQALCTHRRLAVSGMARWWMMRRYLRRTGATRGFFLSLDHLSLPLGLGLPTGRPVSGVLFRPSVHYHTFGAGHPTARERVREWRKEALYRLMLLNPALDPVLTLDPYFPAYARARYRNGGKVTALADPALPASAAVSATDLDFMPPIPAGRTVFVLFGELTERKGVLPLLAALDRLPDDVAGGTAIAIAGRLDPALRPTVREAVDRLRQRHPGLWLHLEDRRLPEGAIAALVSRCDVVLAPYQRFVGSSGILMWASRMRRPLICQDYGLLGHLARQHGLGMTADTTDPAALADAIAVAVRQGPAALGNPERMAAFAEYHTPERFARAVLVHPREDAEERTETRPNLGRRATAK